MWHAHLSNTYLHVDYQVIVREVHRKFPTVIYHGHTNNIHIPSDGTIYHNERVERYKSLYNTRYTSFHCLAGLDQLRYKLLTDWQQWVYFTQCQKVTCIYPPLNPLESMCENIFHLIYFILSLNEDRGIFICFTMKHFCGQLSIRWTNSIVFVQLNRQNLNQRRVDSSVPMSRF